MSDAFFARIVISTPYSRMREARADRFAGEKLLSIGRADCLQLFVHNRSRNLMGGMLSTSMKKVIFLLQSRNHPSPYDRVASATQLLKKGITPEQANYPAYKIITMRQLTATHGDDRRAQLVALFHNIAQGTTFQFETGFNPQVALPYRLLRELMTGHDDGENISDIDHALASPEHLIDFVEKKYAKK